MSAGERVGAGGDAGAHGDRQQGGFPDASDRAREIARTAADSKALEILARIGFAASGAVQLLLGFLIVQLSLSGFAEADQSGAIDEIAKVPGGVFVLWVCVFGLFALGLWLVIEGILMRGGEAHKRWGRRLKNFAKALAYIALGLTALAFALGHPTRADSSTQHASTVIFALPGGPILLVIVGLIAVGVGGYFVTKGVARTFRRDIVLPSGGARVAMLVLGVVGYLGKGLIVALAGVLFIVAAVQAQPAKASGLSGALYSVATLPLGSIVLLVIGIGVIASGVYNVLRAWFARF